MAVRIQFRRGTETEWSTSNPILAAGELGYESTNKIIKFGDGTKTWNVLETAAAGDITSVIAGTGLTYESGTTGYGNAASAGFSGAVKLGIDTSILLASSSIDAKGDLLVGTAPDTYTKVALPASTTSDITNGKSLVADSTQSAGVAWQQVVPPGVIQQYAGATAPAGYLLCNGASFSSGVYGALATVVGDTYGTHSSTTYYLPNLQTRVPVGKNASGTFATLGATGGAETHTLTTAELALHAHTMGSVTAVATNSAVTVTGGAHVHTLTDNGHAHGPLSPSTVFATQQGGGNGVAIATASGGFTQANAPANTATATTGISMGNGTLHTHGTTVTQPTITTTVAANTGNSGSGTAHNNLQPYIVLNYIIKT